VINEPLFTLNDYYTMGCTINYDVFVVIKFATYPYKVHCVLVDKIDYVT